MTKKCYVRIERLPANVLDKSFRKIHPENDSLLQKVGIKSEIKVESHDDFDDQIYGDSVSSLYFIFKYGLGYVWKCYWKKHNCK